MGYPWTQGDELLANDLNAAIANSIGLSSGTLPLNGSLPMTGPLTLAGNATQPLHATPLQQLNSAVAAATAGAPFLSLAIGGMVTGPTYITATGSTASRSLQDRAADVANVLDYGAGIGGDDALAIRNAIASNKKLIFIPPGTYTMKSHVATWGSAQGPSCFEINNRQDTWISAYGATFVMDNAISGTPGPMLSFTNNSKNCGILGGTFVGNFTGLTPTQENSGINFDSVTGLTVRDVKFTGQFLVSICGVYAFDSVFVDCEGYNNANGLDMSHLENVVFRGCRFQANPSNPVTGLSLHYDTPTLGDNVVTNENGTARTLRGGNDNNVRILDCLFQGFGNGIAIDAIAGCLISRTIVRDGLVASTAGTQSGIVLFCGSLAIAAGKTTTDIEITDCDIYGNGVTAGGGSGFGIYLNATGGTIANVNILNNRIYENTASGLYGSGGISGVVVSGNDFRTRSGSAVQTQAIHASFATSLWGGAGIARNNMITAPAGPTELATYANNSSMSWLDSGAVSRPIMGVSAANVTYMRPASNAANIQMQNYAGAALLSVNSAGNSVEATVAIVQANNAALCWRDSSNAVQPIMSVGTGNITYIRPGSAAANVQLETYTGTAMLTADGTSNQVIVASGLRVNGNLGFGVAPIAKPTAGGAWAGNTAGKALSTALAALGLITDTSTA